MQCPYCAHPRSWSLRRHHRKCKRCRREWSAQYPVAAIRLSRERWALLIDAFLDHASRTFVMRRTGLGQYQVRAAITHLRTVMLHDIPAPFAGISEADETYVGGSWKNRRGALWIRKRRHPQGRGTPKQPFLGLLNRETGRVCVWLIPNSKTATILACLCKQLVPGATVYSDGWQPYRHLPELGFRHAFVDHDAGEYVRGDVHTQGIDGFWGCLKRRLAAIGGIRKQYLSHFIGEQGWRYNYRRLTQTGQINRLLQRL